MAESSEDDDYMSDAFLKQCQDVRPGLLSSKAAKQIQGEKLHAKKNVFNKTNFKTRKVLESEKREEGLGVALGSNNKGFAMLQKMGYKPGSGIGKTGEGRIEPVPVVLKTNRGGLGQETHQKRKKEMNAMRIVAMTAKKKKMDEQRKGAFMERMSQQFLDKEAERDLYKSQKVCEQLDSQRDITEPVELFFWPAACLPQKPVTAESDLEEDEGHHGLDENNGYALTAYEGEDSDTEETALKLHEEDEEEVEELPTAEKLEMLTLYLRTKHLYCVWCATNYNDEEDMRQNCPGFTADDHR